MRRQLGQTEIGASDSIFERCAPVNLFRHTEQEPLSFCATTVFPILVINLAI